MSELERFSFRLKRYYIPYISFSFFFGSFSPNENTAKLQCVSGWRMPFCLFSENWAAFAPILLLQLLFYDGVIYFNWFQLTQKDFISFIFIVWPRFQSSGVRIDYMFQKKKLFDYILYHFLLLDNIENQYQSTTTWKNGEGCIASSYQFVSAYLEQYQ